MLENLTHDDFTPLLQEPFAVTVGDKSLTLELAAVNVMDERYSAPAQRRAFSLMFTGPAEPMLEQGTYTMDHVKLGELVLFTVPLGPAGDRQRYEVVFN